MALGFSNYYYLGTHNGDHNVAAGCYVTSLAMAASYLGHIIDPDSLNSLLKTANLIDGQGDIVFNDTLDRIWGDIRFVERVDWPRDPAPLQYFDIRNDVNTEIIVLIDDSPSPGLQQHWLRVVGWDGGSDIIVVDPWDGVRKGLSAYANRSGTSVPKLIYAAVKYQRVIASNPDPIPPADVQQPVVLPTPVPEVDPVISTAPLPEADAPAAPPDAIISDSGNAPAAGTVSSNSPTPSSTTQERQLQWTLLAGFWAYILRILRPRSKKKL